MAVELINATRRSTRLRVRIIAFFALGGLLLSAVLAFTTYGLARQTLVNARERTSLDQAIANAVIVQASLDTSDTSTPVLGPTGLDESGVDDDGPAADPLVADVLNSLASPSGGTQLLNIGGEWQGSGSDVVPGELPDQLLQRVINEATATRMRYDSGDDTFFAVGIPLPASDIAYFEVIPLDELQSSLSLLGLSLVAGGIFTTLLGGGFGVWAARRVLSPLGDISAAAGAIAGGRLDTRLADVEDPDLEALVSSFNGMATALQDRIDRDTRFASDVSHELRSPLMTLRASIDVMQSRRDEMSERGQHALDLLTDDVDRFERLIGDLLEISKIDAGAVAIRRDLVDPGAMLTAAIDAVGHGDLPVVIHPDVEGLLVEVDKRRIAQVLANLLDNAAYYAGGATRVLVVKEGEEVHFVVEDNGPGIPEDERGRVFERFARGTTAGQRGAGGGTGLGLALVSEHVGLHGGQVWVEPRTDGESGSRFIVALPVVTE
ncbi:MAG: HAMP domain-containing sensor histidine kinase [Actinomycetota bacterium]